MLRSKFGYCAVTADFLHIGHIKMLNECKDRCDKLIVGVMTDLCVKEYKGRFPIMSFLQRVALVNAIGCVYKVIAQDSFEFPHSIIREKEFYGNDFIVFDNEKHNRNGADVLIPYMEGISSSIFKSEYLL